MSKTNEMAAVLEEMKHCGQMLIGIPEDNMRIARVKTYLDQLGVHYKEVDENGN